MMDYQDFLASKQIKSVSAGFECDPDAIHPRLFPFQRDIVLWALRKGRAAIFAGTGLGKTLMQLEWSRHVAARTGKRVLIVAPLSVVQQTVEEAQKIDLEIYATRSGDDLSDGINITNYDMIEHFDPADFVGVVLDESSILKNLTGAMRNKLVSMFNDTPYRLACTATPAPNDTLELGNHAAFLGVMTSAQMTSVFFVHVAGVFAGTGQRWRLKRRAEKQFYRWLSSWSIALNKPSDLGYDDAGYDLPDLNVQLHTIQTDYKPDGMLFSAGNLSATEARHARRDSISPRIEQASLLVSAADQEQWVIWTGLNDEADALTDAIPNAVNLTGSMKPDQKVDILHRFAQGDIRVLITKVSIAGFGINMQRAHKMMFFGLDYSWEGYYQAIRRMWRFGQQHPVDVHIVTSEAERGIFDVILHKEEEAIKMTSELILASREYGIEELHNRYHSEWKYQRDEASSSDWRLLLGDSSERMQEIADNSVDLSVYSPPFADMYVYNNTERDLSNSLNLSQFFEHYGFIIRENLRITLPGRLACVHVQDPKTFQNREGYRGLRDFTGMVVAAYIREGWIYRACVTIDKNPQIVASRNKDTDLLFVTGKRDAADLAPMATDYLLIFKKPGDNPKPITPYANGEMTEEQWIEWAHAVWYGIRETDVLNVDVARANDDEKHMCPLQLPVIERCLKLWSNPGDLVFSPFAGIGSEGYEAVRRNRRFVGIELKTEYWRVAQQNLQKAERQKTQMTLFDLLPAASE